MRADIYYDTSSEERQLHGYFSDELSLPSVAMKIHVITEISYHCNVIFLYTACAVNGVDC